MEERTVSILAFLAVRMLWQSYRSLPIIHRVSVVSFFAFLYDWMTLIPTHKHMLVPSHNVGADETVFNL